MYRVAFPVLLHLVGQRLGQIDLEDVRASQETGEDIGPLLLDSLRFLWRLHDRAGFVRVQSLEDPEQFAGRRHGEVLSAWN